VEAWGERRTRKIYGDPETHFTQKKMRLKFESWKVKDLTQKVKTILRP